MGDFDPLDLERNAHLLARRVEFQQRCDEAWAERRMDHLDLQAEHFVHPDTGRHVLEADPELVEVGRHFRRSRRYAGKSQNRLALNANVSQSMVSRTERGLAPGMRFQSFVAMVEALGRIFPMGVCPHDHDCAWQPIRPPKRDKEAAEKLLEFNLNQRDEVDDAEIEPPRPAFTEPAIDISLSDLSARARLTAKLDPGFDRTVAPPNSSVTQDDSLVG